MKLSKSKKIFILLSLAIAIIDGLFVTTNYFYTRQAFHSTLQDESDNYYSIYQTVLESTYNGLSMQATLFAGDKRIQDLFLQGKKAIAREGGTSGGYQAAKIRQELYELVATAWKDATEKFDVRQLHFHLGPGSFTFLRVHKPQKFGDRMDNLRFIIVDTNSEKTPRTGFETGRVYSGLRSVVPVFAWDKSLRKEVYVGALEVGTSYKKLLQTIDTNLDIELNILLNNQHIKNTVWDEYISGIYNNNTIKGCDCILEASSRTGQEALLEEVVKELKSRQQLIHADSHARIVSVNDKFYSVSFHPLRDYLGQKDKSRNNVGAVFIAKNISQQMNAYQEEQNVNILYGLIAYLIVELLLIVTFIKVTRHLTSQVDFQTRELTRQKQIIEQDKIKYKNLADAINSNYFFYTRTIDNHFLSVSPGVTSVLGYTMEEFLNNPLQYLPDSPHTDFVLEKVRQPFIDKEQNTFEVEIYNKYKRLQYLLVTETPKIDDGVRLNQIEGLAQDISHSRLEKMLLQLNCQILEKIPCHNEQADTLKKLALGIESIIQDVSCAIMLFNPETNKLDLSSAPGLPDAYKSVINGIDINSQLPFFCTAFRTAKRKMVKDMSTDPFWQQHEEVIKTYPYKACSSEPVLSSGARVIATIDFYYKTHCTPSDSDALVLATATDLIAALLDQH